MAACHTPSISILVGRCWTDVGSWLSDIVPSSPSTVPSRAARSTTAIATKARIVAKGTTLSATLAVLHRFAYPKP